jgi:hypothetical protein
MLRKSPHPPKDMPAHNSTLQRADRVGFAASFLCAVHCALLPVALALLPAFGLNVGGWVDIDQAFVVFATLLGATTLTLGWRRHRAFHAWMLLIPGLALVWAGSFTHLHDHTITHAVVMTIGGLLLAGAHLLNLRLTHARAGR